MEDEVRFADDVCLFVGGWYWIAFSCIVWYPSSFGASHFGQRDLLWSKLFVAYCLNVLHRQE